MAGRGVRRRRRDGRDGSRASDLTEAQRRAVEHDGRNLQLIACAGSGKTEVVARRVVHLLTPERPGSLEPRNIVAFTFTEKRSNTTRACGTHVANAFCQLDARSAVTNSIRAHPPGPNCSKKGPQRLRAAPLSGPNHPTLVMVDHDRQVAVTFPVAELVD